MAARKRGTPGTAHPRSIRPTDIDDALAIQRRVTRARRLCRSAATNARCRPSRGRSRMRRSSRRRSRAPRRCPVSRGGADGAGRARDRVRDRRATSCRARPPYSEEEVRDAVQGSALRARDPGLALRGFPNVPFPENLADSIANAGLFVGPAVRDPWRHALGEFPDHRHERRQAARDQGRQASRPASAAPAALARQLSRAQRRRRCARA